MQSTSIFKGSEVFGKWTETQFHGRPGKILSLVKKTPFTSTTNIQQQEGQKISKNPPKFWNQSLWINETQIILYQNDGMKNAQLIIQDIKTWWRQCYDTQVSGCQWNRLTGFIDHVTTVTELLGWILRCIGLNQCP